MSTDPAAVSQLGDYIDGRFTAPTQADGQLRVHSPADTDDALCLYPWATAQVDAAVAAARAALPAYRRLPQSERANLLRRYQQRLRHHREAIAHTIAREVGKPLWEARGEADALAAKVDVMLTEGAHYTAPKTVADLPGQIRYRPLGVIAVIGPFNFPGHLPNGQIVPALLLGNTVVHKPSERTPCTATWIARCLDEAGFAPGVFNLVQGEGPSGARLTNHPDVDGVLFTGSVAVGQRIVAANAARPDRLIALELGGKNASIVLDDCDLERSARAIAFAAYATAGQRCTATSRVLATPGIIKPLQARLQQIAEHIRVGYPFDDNVFAGPVISAQARDRVLQVLEQARDCGVEVVVPPQTVDDGRPGFYLRPSLHRVHDLGAAPTAYVQEELFGPDIAVHQAADLDHAIALANDGPYGLAASVFTASQSNFERAADELRVGVLHWNRSSAGASGRLPFGGLGHSGNHRPAGVLAGLLCSDPQALLLPPAVEGEPPSWPGFGV